jgi:hypothetical protein
MSTLADVAVFGADFLSCELRREALMLKMRIIAGFGDRRNFNACDRCPASCRNRIRDLTLARAPESYFVS